MERREFITLLGGAAAWPLAARAQQGERMRRIGVLLDFAADDPEGQARLAAFVQALADLGWTDGRNVRIDSRWGATDVDRIRRHAAELVALAPDVILAGGSYGLAVVATGDPHRADRVRGGHRSGRRWLWSTSLARPGGNATGLSISNTASARNGWNCLSRSRPA